VGAIVMVSAVTVCTTPNLGRGKIQNRQIHTRSC
jgi:hypothetical protein